MAAFEEIYDTDADLHSELRKRRNVFVNRPAYTEEEFQSKHHQTVKEKAPLRTRVKRKVAKCSFSLGTIKKFVFSVVPILSWLPSYDVKNALPRDLMSGVTVGIFRIPHGKLIACVDSYSFWDRSNVSHYKKRCSLILLKLWSLIQW